MLVTFDFSFPMPGDKIRTKEIRVQLKASISYTRYFEAIGVGLACIFGIVLIVFFIFHFREFEVQHDLTCQSGLPDGFSEETNTFRVKRQSTDERDSVEIRNSRPEKGSYSY